MFSSFLLTSMMLLSAKTPATIESPLLVSDVAEFQRAREEVLAWSNSLKSFQGFYSLQQTNYTYANGGVNPVARFDMQVEFRFEGDNRYMMVEDIKTDGSRDQQIAAFFNGSVQHRDNLKVGTEKEEGLAMLEKGTWPFPRGAYLLPTDLFGWDCETPLEKRFERGETYLLKRNGVRVLSHHDGPNSFELYLDDIGRITRIDEVFRPAISLEELQTVWKQKEPFDVFFYQATLELEGYREIDGVSFPALAKKTRYSHNEEEFNRECKSRFHAREIPIYEYQMCAVNASTHVSSVMDFQLDPGTIVLNERIPDSGFKVPLEDGVQIFSSTSGEFSHVYKTPLYARPLTWIVGLVLLLLLGGSGAFYYRRA